MEPNESQAKHNEIRQEVLLVSRYRSICNSKHVGSVLLLVVSVYSILITKVSLPAFYILAANNLLPFFFTFIFRQKKVEELYLPLFSRKYKFSHLSYKCHSISFVCVCILLFVWQQQTIKSAIAFNLTLYLPTAVLFIMVILRFSGNVYFHNKLSRSLLFCTF